MYLVLICGALYQNMFDLEILGDVDNLFNEIVAVTHKGCITL